jgi:hypothetical protein
MFQYFSCPDSRLGLLGDRTYVATAGMGGDTSTPTKRPATYDSRDLHDADVRAGFELPKAPPASDGYGRDFGAAGWLMLGKRT